MVGGEGRGKRREEKEAVFVCLFVCLLVSWMLAIWAGQKRERKRERKVCDILDPGCGALHVVFICC